MVSRDHSRASSRQLLCQHVSPDTQLGRLLLGGKPVYFDRVSPMLLIKLVTAGVQSVYLFRERSGLVAKQVWVRPGERLPESRQPVVRAAQPAEAAQAFVPQGLQFLPLRVLRGPAAELLGVVGAARGEKLGEILGGRLPALLQLLEALPLLALLLKRLLALRDLRPGLLKSADQGVGRSCELVRVVGIERDAVFPGQGSHLVPELADIHLDGRHALSHSAGLGPAGRGRFRRGPGTAGGRRG